MNRSISSVILVMLLSVGIFAQPTRIPEQAQPDQFRTEREALEYERARANGTWCPTDIHWVERRKRLQKMGVIPPNKAAACPTEGPCDNPVTRDGTVIQSQTIDVIVHVIRDDSGNGGISQSVVNDSIVQMNSDYSQTGISFNLTATRFHNDSNYSCISAYSPFNSSWFNDIQNLKATYSESPETQLNVFVSCQSSSGFGVLLGIATFPWDPNALTSTGGLWVNNIAMGSGLTTLSHETGHCLGLWHTQHGVSEVDSCSDCYEYASGFEGDFRGDFAADTPPTPTNYDCSDPGGSDCQGTAWGITQPENYMGYAPDSCMNLFSANQISRMHCWTNDVLSGWIGGGTTPTNTPPTASFSATTTDLTADFDASASGDSDGSIVAYDWTFGDGATGSGQTTSHTYASDGTYTVTLTVTDDDGATDVDSQNVTVSTSTSGGISLSASGYKVRGRQKADLTWSGASTSSVEIYRDGVLITTTANDGSYTDPIDNRGGGSYVYELCDVGGGCSNTVTVTF